MAFADERGGISSSGGNNSCNTGDEAVYEDKSHGNLATFFSAYISLTNTIIGSGILGLPYAFSCTGWFLGMNLLFLCAGLSAMSLHLLALCASRTTKPSSFYAVAQIVSPSYAILIDIAVALKCFGVATSYLIVIGDLMPDVMQELGVDGMWLHRSCWVVVGFVVVAPMSFYDSLNAFKWTSTVSLIFIAIIAAVVIAYALPTYRCRACMCLTPPLRMQPSGLNSLLLPLPPHSGLNPCLGMTEADATNTNRHRSLSVLNVVGLGWSATSTTTATAAAAAAASPGGMRYVDPAGTAKGVISAKNFNAGFLRGCVGEKIAIVDHPQTILRALPIFVFGFTCQQNIFSVVNELRMPTPHRVSGVVFAAVGTALVLYAAVALFGYSTFGSSVHSDILTNYPDNLLTTLARTSVTIMVTFSYPLQVRP